MQNNSTNSKYNHPPIGCYIDESSGSADDCNRRTIDFASDYGFKADFDLQEDDEDYSQILSDTADDAVDFLNDQETRSFLSWRFEDNSLFLLPNPDSAREDVGFVSSKDQDYPNDDYEGEWLHVSDHGNATLYVREDGRDKEIWSIV